MCGIVSFVGRRGVAVPLLVEGLKRLEYRGYDSSGVAVIGSDAKLRVRRAVGRISVLEDQLSESQSRCSVNPNGSTGPLPAAKIGIAHTRWATHGAPTEANAHPHTDSSGRIALVHNGIVENYGALRQLLQEKGHVFHSQTDTEALVVLIGDLYEEFKRQNHASSDESLLERSVRAALRQVEGTYGIAVICSEEPETLVVARKGSPMIVGVGEGEYVAASDASAIVEHTTNAIYLNDGEMAVLRPGQPVRTLAVEDDGGGEATVLSPVVSRLEHQLEAYELGEYEHYMLKEIYEQPDALRNCLRGRVDRKEGRIVLGGLAPHIREVTRARRYVLVGQGTAWHATLIGDYLLEDLAKVPAEATYASEFRYRNPIVEEGTVAVAVSQSGETADTLAAVREAKEKGSLTLGLVNVVGSTIAREVDGGIYLHAGPEIGVASTKAFVCQVACLTMLAMHVGRRRLMSQEQSRELIDALCELPEKMQHLLDREKHDQQIRDLARKYCERENWLFLGRGYHYPVALEGALKLKEISYIHAEGMPAAEMKHGPIALVSPGMPAVFVATKGPQYDKVIGNIEEVRARGGEVIAVATEGDTRIEKHAEHVLYIPDAPEPLQPMLGVIPLQLLAYHAALARGCNVDKPRNLAKSVTVE